jgi:hypothetical protein
MSNALMLATGAKRLLEAVAALRAIPVTDGGDIMVEWAPGGPSAMLDWLACTRSVDVERSLPPHWSDPAVFQNSSRSRAVASACSVLSRKRAPQSRPPQHCTLHALNPTSNFKRSTRRP